MTRSLRSLCSRVLLAAACMLASAVSFFVTPAVGLAVATCRKLKTLVLDGFKLAASEPESQRKPAVWRVKAKAFILRLAKRDRPEVSGSWRMCPSC